MESKTAKKSQRWYSSWRRSNKARTATRRSAKNKARRSLLARRGPRESTKSSRMSLGNSASRRTKMRKMTPQPKMRFKWKPTRITSAVSLTSRLF